MNPPNQSKLQLNQIAATIKKYTKMLAQNPEEPKIHLNLGNLYAQQEKWQKAISSYQNAVKINPELAEAYRNLAKVYLKIGNETKAANFWYKAIKLEPTSKSQIKQYFGLGNTFKAQKKLGKAADCYRQGIKLQPDLLPGYHVLSKVLNEQGKHNEVIKLYRQGVKKNPQNPKFHLALAQALASQKQWRNASNRFRQALDLDSNLAVGYYHWGYVLSQMKKRQEAEECYTKAVELKPEYWEAYYQLGIIFQQDKKWQKAKYCYEKVTHFNKEFVSGYLQLALVYQKLQQYQLALKACHQALSIAPESSPFEEQAIAIYQKILDNYSQLLPDIAQQFNKEFASGYLQLSLTYQKLEQYQRALETCHQALSITPESSSLEDEAIANYRLVLDNHPQLTSEIYYQFGQLLRKKSRFIEAISAYQKTISIEPNFRLAHIDLQYTCIPPKQLPGHIDFYRQIVAKYPQLSIAWGNLGDALTQQKNIQEAITCYRKSCYLQAINTYPKLAKLHWKEVKESGPDFIIIGAAKCGTTSVYEYLGNNPKILLPHKKELNFFWKKYDYGIDWYLAHFPTITDRDDFITGEASPHYIRFPVVAQRIKQHFPDIKLILLLRNPVDRTISWHYHQLNRGLFKEDVETAIYREIKELESLSQEDIINNGHSKNSNIITGLYIYQVKTWLELFKREQILILSSEYFYSNTAKAMEEVYNFLGLPNYPLARYPKINTGSYSPADERIRNILKDYFEPYNRQLEEYLGMEFNWS
ncbi:MAG: tetratricopeptide repeat protein [Xenococcaceae cyanobacterium MO_207.B15]|nr:tetratricopeptide repeat protein [Xenococcaceae cyanobacterium MO_207.B15]